MPCCVAINCANRTEKGVRLFLFPADDVRRQQWIYNLCRESWTPTKYSRLCEEHFEESQFETNRADNWRKLKPNAIPTLFDIPDPLAIKKNETNEPNTSATAEKDNCRDQENVDESITESSILPILAENQSLKQQLERIHKIIKCFAHHPAVAAYLQKYNVK
nr:PREDICTED: THAP domain-containing protein 4-like [Linepithema humile]